MKNEILGSIGTKVALSPYCNLKCTYCGGADRTYGYPATMEDFRKSPLKTGVISTDTLLESLNELYSTGLREIRFTGGEPMLRHDWDRIVTETSRMGYQRVDITTNGLLLEPYLKIHHELPSGLAMIKVSLDTYDPNRFREITGGGILEKVIKGVRAASDQVYVRTNKVVLRSEQNEEELVTFIEFCKSLGISEIQYLDLIHHPNKPNSDKDFFEREYVAFPEFRDLIKRVYDINFQLRDGTYGAFFHQAILPDGFKITFKDIRFSMRDTQCQACPLYCQEGRCLIRIGTDGNLTLCTDYRGELSSFNLVEEIKKGTLDDRMNTVAEIYASATQMRTIENFAERYNIRLPDNI